MAAPYSPFLSTNRAASWNLLWWEKSSPYSTTYHRKKFALKSSNGWTWWYPALASVLKPKINLWTSHAIISPHFPSQHQENEFWFCSCMSFSFAPWVVFSPNWFSPKTSSTRPTTIPYSPRDSFIFGHRTLFELSRSCEVEPARSDCGEKKTLKMKLKNVRHSGSCRCGKKLRNFDKKN